MFIDNYIYYLSLARYRYDALISNNSSLAHTGEFLTKLVLVCEIRLKRRFVDQVREEISVNRLRGIG